MDQGSLGDKHCPRCKETKPRSAFSMCRSTGDGLNAYCRQCSSAMNKAGPVKPRKSRANRDKPTSWLVPGDPRPFMQKLIAATQKRWRYPVEPSNDLTWSLGARKVA